ncbi:MAG: hypothetical protein ACO3A2_01020 [Bdellovibrionia bacterium]
MELGQILWLKGAMTAAFITGLLATVVCLWIGLQNLGLSASTLLQAILVSNGVGLISIFFTLRVIRKLPPLKSGNLGLIRAWMILVSVYLTLFKAFCPSLGSLESFFSLIFPLILTNGFSILIFGPIQDYLVRLEQKKRR